VDAYLVLYCGGDGNREALRTRSARLQHAIAADAYPPAARVEDVRRTVYTETKPYGPEQVRQAYLSAGDTMALIVQSRKGHAEAAPFQQTVTLQSQLLG
ncbi:hypothetical protein ABZS63_28965, partial [Streptomyces sp. NPDC005568]